MNDQQNENEAADGGSALTAVLGDLADQFECHALSRSIDNVEAAGRAMRDAKAEIERLRAQLAEFQVVVYRREWGGDESDLGEWLYAGADERDHQGVWEPLYAKAPNACGEPGLTDSGKD